MTESRGSSRLWRTAMAACLVAALLLTSGAVAALQGPRGTKLAATTPTVFFDPNPIQVGMGTLQNVDVVVENIEGLYAIEVRLAYPNTLVQAADADLATAGIQVLPGTVFNGFDSYVVQNRVDPDAGVVEYIVSITGSQTGFSGSGTIMTLPLQGILVGDAVMSFVEVILCERDGTSIPVNIGDGQSDIDVVNETSTPTATLPGGPTAIPTQTLTPGPSPTPDGNLAQVVIAPLTQQIEVGDQEIVQVEILNADDLYLFDIRLDYNGVLLDAEDAEASQPGVQVYMGNVFDGLSYQVQENLIVDDGIFGQAQVLASVDTGQPSGFSGDGILFWVVFEGAVPGLSNITLAEVTLADHAGTTLARNLAHGQVEVVPVGSALTPSPTNDYLSTPTYTMTPTAGPSATPSPVTTTPITLTASATPTGLLATPTPVCSDRIVNGGFEIIDEDDAPPWVVSGSTTFSPVEHHAGAYSAWLGGIDNAQDILYQTVTIPAHPLPIEMLTEATLRFWWGMTTAEVTHAQDFMWVRVRDNSGGLLATLLSVDDGSLRGQWQEAEFDLSAYEGQTIRISFEAETNGSAPTSFWLDDVSLIICEVLEPAPPPTATNSPTISPTATNTGVATATPSITPTPVIEIVQYDEGNYERCFDSHISSWTPADNFGHSGALSIRTNDIKRPLVYFDISHLPAGIRILDAKLWLYSSHYKSHDQDMTVSAYGLKKPWQEMQVTWVHADDSTTWALTGAQDTILDRDQDAAGSKYVAATNAWHDIDVTSLAQAWSDGSRANNGMILVATGNTVEMSFWSSEYSIKDLRPKLVIQYTFGSAGTPIPTVTPAVSPTAGPTPTETVTPSPMGNEMIFQENHLGYAGVDDTYLSLWQPTDRYGGNVTLIVRQGDVRTALLRFDVSALPAGSTIHDAQLELYSVSRSNAGGINMAVYPVMRPWAEGQANWTQATTATAWGLPGCNQTGIDRAADAVDTIFVNTVNVWNTWNVTSLVQGWVNTPGTNNGVIIKGSGTTAVEYSYAATEYWWAEELSPRLVVRYSPS